MRDTAKLVATETSPGHIQMNQAMQKQCQETGSNSMNMNHHFAMNQNNAANMFLCLKQCSER